MDFNILNTRSSYSVLADLPEIILYMLDEWHTIALFLFQFHNQKRWIEKNLTVHLIRILMLQSRMLLFLQIHRFLGVKYLNPPS